MNQPVALSWIKQLRSQISKLLDTGLDDTYSLADKQRGQLMYSTSVFVTFMQVSLLFVTFFLAETNAFILAIFMMIGGLGPSILVRLGKVEAASWYFCAYFSGVVAIGSISFGTDVVHPNHMAIFVIPMILFLHKFQSRLFFMIFLVTLYSIASYYVKNYDSPFARDFSIFEEHVVNIVEVLFAAIVLNYYRSLVLNNEKRVAKLLKQQTIDNEELIEKQRVIEQQNQQLVHANEELEKFAYIASHDLKSPLRNISSFLSLMRRRIIKGRTEGILEDLEYAQRASSQMYQLIEDILQFSTMKQQQIAFQQTDLNDILLEVIVNLDHSLKSQNAEIRQGVLPTIPCMPSQVMLLFQNLIENGIKYNNSEEPLIIISAEEYSDEVLIKVQDNGIGIPMQYRERVFKMFSRLHTQKTYEGTGLGLSICRRVVDAHQGDIWFESDGENGTTFYIELPKTQEHNSLGIHTSDSNALLTN